MTASGDNPWAAQFSSLLDKDEIFRRAEFTPAPLGDLSGLAPLAATKILQAKLESVYFPTDQCVDLLYGFVGLAYQHCLEYYPNRSFFLDCIYSGLPPLPAFCPLFCLTGQAGSGKSALLRALQRVQEPARTVLVDAGHGPFQLIPIWNLSVHANGSVKDLLSTLSGGSGSPRDLVKLCRRLAFRDGVAMLTVDEFQFATGSSGANTIVTQMLLSSGYIGVPPIFAANFSLLHRLMRRPSEDRQRLLSYPLILHPEAPDSADWINTLKAQKAAAPGILIFDPVKDGPAIHRYSAADMRAEVALLLCAYQIGRNSGGVVSLREIEHAYHSTEYAVYRHDVEAIARLGYMDAKTKRNFKDLWCPLELPADAAAKFAERTTKARQARADDQAARDSLTRHERKALDAMEGFRDTQKPEKTGEIRDLKKAQPPTTTELLANFVKFRDRI